MANYIKINLDTTGPKIEIYGLSYTVKGTDYVVKIKSNEKLMQWQDIYILDSSGIKIPVTLSLNEGKDSLTGIIRFEQASIGMAKIYALLKDEVGNLSNLSILNVNVMSFTVFYCTVCYFVQLLLINEEVRKIELSAEERRCQK